MLENWFALLVQGGAPDSARFGEVLRMLGIRCLSRAIAGGRAADTEQQRYSPVVFTETSVTGGDWKDIIRAAAAAPQATSVVVVSRFDDVHLYRDAMERGAHDFIVPPYTHMDVFYVARSAIRGSLSRRGLALPESILREAARLTPAGDR